MYKQNQRIILWKPPLDEFIVIGLTLSLWNGKCASHLGCGKGKLIYGFHWELG